MRVQVIKRFKDKKTKALHEIGNIIEVTKKRLSEINSTSYGVLVEVVEDTVEQEAEQV